MIKEIIEHPKDSQPIDFWINSARRKFKIGTHDGFFHADDVLALALLKRMFWCDFEIVRTRDKAILDSCDILVDVGGKYDGKKYFDHHHDRDLPCSVSLVWTAIWEWGGVDDFVYQYVNETVLDSVSALDTDLQGALIKFGDNKAYYNISSLLSDFNGLDGGFEIALDVADKFWTAILVKGESIKKERLILELAEELDTDSGKSCIILSEGVDVGNHLKWFQENDIQFIIHPHYNPSKICLKTVNSKLWPLPEKIEAAEFVHAARFLAIFNNKDIAINCVKNL